MIYTLPESVEVKGKEYAVRSDFRDILEVISVLNDEGLTDQERGFFSLLIFYKDFQNMPSTDYQEAVDRMYWFIACGDDKPKEEKQPLMDWEKDFPLIIGPVNRVLGHEARQDEHLHWWTFVSAYMEIGDCTFAQVIHIRDSLRRGKALDKSDAQWYRENKELVDLPKKISRDDLEDLKKWGG